MRELNKVKVEIEGRVYVKKNSRRLFNRGGKQFNLPSKKFEEFKEMALWQLKSVRGTVKPPYKARYCFFIKGKQDGDLDNLIASVNDVLQDAGVITDDRAICEINKTKKIMGCDDFKTIIELETLNENEKK